jgi:creatinine deaminase
MMLQQAVEQAELGLREGGVPVGAVLSDGGHEPLGVGRNQRVQAKNPIAHGEISCLENAGRRSSYRRTTLYTTLSPCLLCQGAIRQFKIPRVVIGDASTFSVGVQELEQAGIEVIIAEDPRCASLMREFQSRYPSVWAEDIGDDGAPLALTDQSQLSELATDESTSNRSICYAVGQRQQDTVLA